MKSADIKSSTLPFLGDHTKTVINQGLWFLYGIKGSSCPNARFLLRANKKEYFLDKQGAVLSEKDGEATEGELTEFVYFSDIPRPESLSTMELYGSNW